MFWVLIVCAWLTAPAGPEAAGQPRLPPVVIVGHNGYTSEQACKVDGAQASSVIASQDGVDRMRFYCLMVSDPGTEKAS